MIENVENHFVKRSKKYNYSSNWVADKVLIKKIYDMAEARSEDFVLDIAVGTGLIAKEFYKKVKKVVGVDICPTMVMQASKYTDKIVLSRIEDLPFDNNYFDICVCRQGLQFMQLDTSLSQIHRVLKVGGTVVFCHLTAYNNKDKKTAFCIQKLRNPARKNFFLPEDFFHLLKKYNFEEIKSEKYISKESINKWINHDAISQDQMKKIKIVYKEAPEEFIKIHNVRFTDNDIIDSMMMFIVKATKLKD